MWCSTPGCGLRSLKSMKKCASGRSNDARVSSQITSRNAGLAKCLCQPPLVGNWARGSWGAWVADRHYIRHCAFTVNPYKPVRRALTWLTTALVECNALHTILAPVQAFYEGESGALNWPFWEVFWELTLASQSAIFVMDDLILIFKMLSASISLPPLFWLVSSLEYCFQK